MSGTNEPGLGTSRDRAGMEAGTTRSEALGDRGTGEVHTHIGVARDTDTGYSAIAATGSTTGQSAGGQGGTMDRVRDKASQAKDRAQEAMQGMPDRVNEAAGQAREKMGQALGRAERVLDERGVLNVIRENPLPALGVAFGIGFLLAGSGDGGGERGGRERGGGGRGGKRSGMMETATNQLKGAIMGGLSAAVAQEGRNLLGMAQGKGNQGGFLGSLMENLQGGGGGRSGGGSSSGGTTHRPPSHQEMR